MSKLVYRSGCWDIVRAGDHKWGLWRWLPVDGIWCFYGFYRTKKAAIAETELPE